MSLWRCMCMHGVSVALHGAVSVSQQLGEEAVRVGCEPSRCVALHDQTAIEHKDAVAIHDGVETICTSSSTQHMHRRRDGVSASSSRSAAAAAAVAAAAAAVGGGDGGGERRAP